MPWFENKDLENIYTPIDAEKLNKLLKQAGYQNNKRVQLYQGFKYGFSLGYEGEKNVQKTAPNLKFRVGDKWDMWSKVMKEVQAKRYAGPFTEPPFEHYIQSPIGLVPKDKGTKTRSIFHLSYPKDGDSVNSGIDPEKCSVKYADFDDAIRRCQEEGIFCFVSRSDLSMAFRQVPLDKLSWPWLLLRAQHPVTGKWYWFADKCLRFGSSVSCKLFQDFSDCLAFLVEYRTKRELVNYLDDFLFIALLKTWCNWQLQVFLDLCDEINFPVSMEKTEWVCTQLIFLGILIDTIRQVACIPHEKVLRAKNLISEIMEHKNVTVYQMQRLCGFLNFLCKCVVPGRAFLMRLYAAIPVKLKSHHHFRVTREVKADLNLWFDFVSHADIFCRPFMDFTKTWTGRELRMYSDAAGSWV